MRDMGSGNGEWQQTGEVGGRVGTGLNRRRMEVVLRIIGVAAVVGWIVNAIVPRAEGVMSVRADELGDALLRWTRDASAQNVHVRFDTIPDAASSAWLAALRGAGTRVSWEGDALLPIAVETYPATSPAGGTVVLASAGDSVSVLRDALGPLDTLRATGATAVRLASHEGNLTLEARDQVARASAAERAAPKRVFVAGAAGWEGKFLIAALEEAGWQVDARLFVAPGEDVVQGGGRTTPDTARHAAAVLLDSAAAETIRGVEPFVRAGGGVVLAGDASRARRGADLVRWRAGARETAPLGTMPGDPEWRGLSRVPLRLASDTSALPLETRGDAATIVARRHHAGRVAAVGYDATWRWRMAGGEESVAQHRAWWSQLVSSVAMRASPEPATGAATGAAPLAEMHDMLGSPTLASATAMRIPRDVLANLFGALALGALLTEWLMRRARGAR